MLAQYQYAFLVFTGLLAFIGIYLLLFKNKSSAAPTKLKQLQLSLQKKEEHINELVFEVLAKGWFPVVRKTHLGGVTYIYDSFTKYPCFSTLSETMEANSNTYAKKVSFGIVNKNTVIKKWSPICKFDIKNLIPPQSGSRVFEVVTYLYSVDNPIKFIEGECTTPNAIIQKITATLKVDIKTSGYREAQQVTNETKRCCIDIAVGLCHSSGHFKTEYKKLIAAWITRALKKSSAEHRDAVQQDLAATFEKSFKKCQDAGRYDFSLVKDSIDTLNQVNSDAAKHEVMELCLAMIGSSNTLDGNLVYQLKAIAQALNVDQKLLEKNIDRIIIKLERITPEGEESDAEAIVGINAQEQSKNEIMDTINMQYRKWNGRLNSLRQGNERDKAQQMLDLLAGLRLKYEKQLSQVPSA